MNRFLSTVTILAALAPGAPGAYSPARVPEQPGAAAAAETGAIEGRVELELVGAAEPPMLSPYSRRRYRPPTPAPSTPGSPVNVVVYVMAEEGAGPASGGSRAGASSAGAGLADPPPVEVAQRDRTIIPHVTAVPAGTEIRFPNRDDVFHNLFSLSDANPFNLGRYPPGDSRSERFERAGVVRVFCDIHSDMGGLILVLDTRWITRPDEEGRYRLEGLPAGRHRVVAWHESAGADTVTVEVPAGGTARTDFRLPGR